MVSRGLSIVGNERRWGRFWIILLGKYRARQTKLGNYPFVGSHPNSSTWVALLASAKGKGENPHFLAGVSIATPRGESNRARSISSSPSVRPGWSWPRFAGSSVARVRGCGSTRLEIRHFGDSAAAPRVDRLVRERTSPRFLGLFFCRARKGCFGCRQGPFVS